MIVIVDQNIGKTKMYVFRVYSALFRCGWGFCRERGRERERKGEKTLIHSSHVIAFTLYTYTYVYIPFPLHRSDAEYQESIKTKLTLLSGSCRRPVYAIILKGKNDRNNSFTLAPPNIFAWYV